MKTRKNKCIVHTVQICYLTVYCFECMNTYIISTANVIPAKSTDYNGFTVLFMFNQLTRTIIYGIHMCELIYVTESADLDV